MKTSYIIIISFLALSNCTLQNEDPIFTNPAIETGNIGKTIGADIDYNSVGGPLPAGNMTLSQALNYLNGGFTTPEYYLCNNFSSIYYVDTPYDQLWIGELDYNGNAYFNTNQIYNNAFQLFKNVNGCTSTQYVGCSTWIESVVFDFTVVVGVDDEPITNSEVYLFATFEYSKCYDLYSGDGGDPIRPRPIGDFQ